MYRGRTCRPWCRSSGVWKGLVVDRRHGRVPWSRDATLSDRRRTSGGRFWRNADRAQWPSGVAELQGRDGRAQRRGNHHRHRVERPGTPDNWCGTTAAKGPGPVAHHPLRQTRMRAHTLVNFSSNGNGFPRLNFDLPHLAFEEGGQGAAQLRTCAHTQQRLTRELMLHVSTYRGRGRRLKCGRGGRTTRGPQRVI